MKRSKIRCNKIKFLGVLGISCFCYLAFISPHESIEAAKSTATHIGTFEGVTMFTTSSRNGINPGLFIEVMDEDGNLMQYESEEGVITIPNTKEGAYVTQAKLLGKTKYVDEDTGEILEEWEEGRNLRLESSENPVLKAKNKFNADDLIYVSTRYEGNTYFETDGTTLDITMTGAEWARTIFNFDYESGKRYNLSFIPIFNEGEEDGNWCVDFNGDMGNRTYLKHGELFSVDFTPTGENIIQLCRLGRSRCLFTNFIISEVGMKGEPYQSNTIALDKDVTLRGVGDIRDELNLITGEVTNKLGYTEHLLQDLFNFSNGFGRGVSYNASTDRWVGMHNGINHAYFKTMLPLNFSTTNNENSDVSIYKTNSDWFSFAVKSSELISKGYEATADGLVDYAMNEKMICVYKLLTESAKAVRLTSDYFFKPIYKDSVQVTGTITPLVGSITVPTTPVSFVLNPNQEAGQQFIAPEFSVSNDTTAPIRLTLNSFEQTTTVLNDVLPDKYDNWEGLNKKESKDIALALVPKVSDGWVSLTEGHRYVVESSNGDLGVVKAKSSVDFTFSALHGQAFEEVLNPSYRLGFTFEFMN